MNSAVIEPDLEGYGVTADRFACGISFATQARQAIDCVLGHSLLWRLSLQTHKLLNIR